MRIEAIETFVVDAGCVVQIHTESGVSGVGQGTFFSGPQVTEKLVETYIPSLLGRDAYEIERHWQLLHRASSFRGTSKGSALSAIDMALWDIKGKALGVPVWQLLGGRYRHSVRLYRNIGRANSVDDLVDRARKAVADGYSAIKVDPVPFDFLDLTYVQASREIVSRVDAVRETVGHDVDVAVDMHNRLSPAEAMGIGQNLIPFNLLFFEDPIPTDSIRSYGDLAQRLAVPIATGERLWNVYEYRELMEVRGATIIRPDIGIAGGLTQCKKIAALAEAYHVALAPHHTIAPIAAAAELHLAASIPNFAIQSYLDDHLSPMAGLVTSMVVPSAGYMAVPEGAGLGVEVNRAYLTDHGAAPLPLGAPEGSDGSVGYA